MPGLSANIINLITDNLRDRYQSGYPILKELIQNADDAGAQRFVFGDHPGFSNAINPLLLGPGLYCYNNGGFKQSDKKAIAAFAENTKAAEEGTIGKFGLGMKSVFHLCEAFFYVANDGIDIHRQILNPWNTSDDNIHPHWENVSDLEWRGIENVAREISGDDRKWFFLWIPLRQKHHLVTENGEDTGSIMERFPGDDGLEGPDLCFLRDSSLRSRLASILPLLLNLSCISFRSISTSRTTFTLLLESDGRLERKTPEASSTGKVYDLVDDLQLNFHGKKLEAVGSPVFAKLKKHPKWPKTFCRNSKGYLSPTEDKSCPEGSVLIGQQKQGKGKLSIQWALFLPLEDESHFFETSITTSLVDYRIYIHGQFFVDAGRRGIFAYSQMRSNSLEDIESLDETGIRRFWNQELARNISLPLFIPTLDEFVRKNNLAEPEIHALTTAIVNASSKDGSGLTTQRFMERFKLSICANHSWCRSIQRETQIWTRIDHSKPHRLLPLPTPPKADPARPWVVLPLLDSMGNEISFVDAEAPYISMKIDQWTENDLMTILGANTFKAFSSLTHLEYLANFIECAAGQYLYKLESIQKILFSLIREAFRNTPISVLRQNRQRVINVVKFLLPQYRLAIGPQDTAAGTAIPEHLLSVLWKCDASVLIIPKDIDSTEKPGTAEPHRNDVLEWLRTLHSQLATTPHQNTSTERCLDVANLLLNKLEDADRAAILRTNPELIILKVTDARTLQFAAVSYATLEHAHKRNNLFGFTQGTTFLSRVGLTRLLADVVPEERIFLTNIETVKTLFANSVVLPSSGSGEALLISLGTIIKKLGSVPSRQKLIEHADNPGQNYLARKGLRYLLHGDETHFADDSTPLWVARHKQSTAWEKLWRHVSLVESDDTWNILGEGFTRYVLQARWDILGIKEIEPSDVIDELGRIGAYNINPSSFSDAECEEILAYIDDENIWTSLPFHPMKSGEKSRIDCNTYLDAGISLQIDLSYSIKIVERSKIEVILNKQKAWIPPLDESAIIQIALQHEKPSRFHRLIVDMLENFGCPICEETSRLLRETKWLPLRMGGIIRPVDVINIEALSQDVQLLAAKAGYCYADVADISEDIQQSTALETLKARCFVSGDDALLTLGLLMAEIEGYNVGEIDFSDLFTVINAMPALAKIEVLPSWSIIYKACKVFGEEKCLNALLPAVGRPVTSETLVSALLQLSADCSRNNKSAEHAFRMYLRAFCADVPVAKLNLARLSLRTMTGNWRSASELCTGAVDVDAEYILDRSLVDILSDVAVDAGQFNAAKLKTIGHAELGLAIQSAPGVVESYFNKWKGLVRDELIGATLCLLGSHLRELAEYYLCGHTYDWVVNQIGWRSAKKTDANGNVEWVRDYMPAERLDSLKVGFRTVDEDRVAVHNLLGDYIEIRLSKKFSTIIAGAPVWEGDRRVYIPLRSIALGNLPSEDLSSLIKETARYILEKCYCQPNALLDGLWQELEKIDQLQIDVVRAMILDHLPFYLRQLNANHKSERLKLALEKYDQARERYQECKNTPTSSPDKLERLSLELDNQRKSIADLLLEDESTKKAVLESLKQKLRDFQYDVQSLPFELYQNADDAATELGFFDPDDNGNAQVPVPSQKFVVDVDGSTLRFMHWGRMINWKGPISANGDTRGFHRDLEKMLVLSSSDKPIGEGVTGKFGLGFKSVFLCCDRPCLLSGLLRVEIVGGVLPRQWIPSQSAVDRLTIFSEDRRYKGTQIELQLNDEVSADDILDRFRSLIGVLCIFGRSIRRIIVASPRDELTQSWNPTHFLEGVEIGRCELPDGNQMVSRYGIAFRLKSGVTYFTLDPEGFIPLSKKVPSVWVTAPTREDESLGFAVSAAFSLDAGRGRLAGESEENRQLAEKIGRELGVKIASLVDRLEIDWPSARSLFHISNSVSLAGFLTTIWRTLSIAATSNDGTGICSTVAMKALVKLSNGSIPNGLPAPFERLDTIDCIRHELPGPWGQREVIELLGCVEVAVEQCIASDLASILRRLDLGRSIRKLDFSYLVQLIERKHCEGNTAVNLETIADLVWEQLKEEEKKQASDELAMLQFKSVAGDWKASKDLLCDGIGDKEEELRVRFAPDSARLADSYNEKGRAFFRRSRPRYDAPTELLAEWILKADCETMQQAALHYLVHGELGHKVARCLRQNGLDGTWLETIRESHNYLESWSASDIDDLLRMLAKVHYDESSPPPVQSPQPQLTPQKVLQAIYDWWQDNKFTLITKYEKDTFPGGYFPSLDFDLLREDPEARKGWLTLLLLGACHTIGRSTPMQHRNFIAICQSKGWIDKFISVDQDGLEEWMEVLKNYLKNEIQDPIYYHWMRQFISIFVFSYWLDEYVEGFLSINRVKDSFSLKQFTCLSTNSFLQGGGVEAPPIDRALGMGACFVMRELVRNKKIINELAHQYCYVPRKPVRDFMERLGCEGLNNGYDYETRSRIIHEFLCKHLGEEKATFDKNFDLPLLLVASDPELQNELFQSILVYDAEIEEDVEYDQ